MTESRNHDVTIEPMDPTGPRRANGRAVGFIAGGVVLTGALVATALIGLAVTSDAAEVAETKTETTVRAASSPSTSRLPTPIAVVAAPSTAEVFATQWAGMTEAQRIWFNLYIATPEQLDAFRRWINPPAPPAPKPAPAPAPKPAAKATTPTTKAAPPATRPAPKTATVSASSAGHAGPGGYFACVRKRESGGNYAINTGNGYYGAYQFLPSTWNATAKRAGRPDLVGVLPSNASPADQDAMASSLYASNGRQPWPNGC